MALTIAGERATGQDVRTELVTAAVSVANIVKTSLGPIGMDKMLVDDVGDVLVSNDGATILKRLDVEHPAARLLVDLSALQDTEVGDGTTSVVILAAELLKRANQLIAQRIHATTVIAGYRHAMRAMVEYIDRTLKYPTKELGPNVLLSVAQTSLSSKILGVEASHFAQIAVDAVTSVRKITDSGDVKYNVKAVGIIPLHGASARESLLVDGFALHLTRAAQGMPMVVRGKDAAPGACQIALLDFDLRVSKMKMGVNIVVTDPAALADIKRREADITKERIAMLLAAGVHAIFTTGGIDDVNLKYLVEAGVFGVRRVKRDDMKRLAKATGGSLLTSLASIDGDESVETSALGRCDSVGEERFGDDEVVVVRGGKAKTNSTVLLRGANDLMLDEMGRALNDAMHAVARVLESPSVVAGGGAVEAAGAVYLDQMARMMVTREQLAVAEFSDALLVIPRQLALNAAQDATTLTSKLVVHYASTPAAGGPGAGRHYGFGLDLLGGEVRDNVAAGVLEPAVSKIKSIQFATEAAITILRIDDKITLEPRREEPGGGGCE